MVHAAMTASTCLVLYSSINVQQIHVHFRSPGVYAIAG